MENSAPIGDPVDTVWSEAAGGAAKVGPPSLPYPVTFVCFGSGPYADLFERSDEAPDPGVFKIRRVSSEEAWSVLTYVQLKSRGFNVSISERFVPGRLCVASTLCYGIRSRPFDCFVVGCRSDGPRPALCDFTIVQNRANVDSKTTIFIPHWPQPGLIPRSGERGHRLECMVYMGDLGNLYRPFRTGEFEAQLAGLGVHFRKELGTVEQAPPDWFDYRTVDLFLAVRDLTEKDALVKPASKLVNAWRAGVPALLGPEAAYRDMRQSELDYIEIRTPQDAIDAISRLKSNSSLYEAMVTNAHRRAVEFTDDRHCQRWVDVLSGPIAEEYGRWLKKSLAERLAVTPLRYMRQKLAQRSANYHRHHGYRIASGRTT
jgi:hypothetical protein